MPGTLYVVATPLGHVADLSPRAREVLDGVGLVACEDTRRTGRLLARLGISTPRVSCHRFNEQRRLAPILERLRAGESVALVSDGGTPGVSDPGRLLVLAALEAGLAVSPVPGPSAVTALLSVSGLPADRYVFEGFLPHRSGERRRRLRTLREETRTLVAYESPQRIRESLRDIAEVLGPREVVVGRELTKLHETLLHGTPTEILGRLDPTVRGEITLAVAGASAGRSREPSDLEAERVRTGWRRALERHGGDRRAALRDLSRRLGLRRAALFRRLAELGEDDG